MWPLVGGGVVVGEVVVVGDVVAVDAVVVVGAVVVDAVVVVDDVLVTTVFVPPGFGCPWCFLVVVGRDDFVGPARPVAAVKPPETRRTAAITKTGLGGEMGGIRLPFIRAALADQHRHRPHPP
jgi:hypothetical protein